ncbi:DNA polymerase III subunit chi [Shewanella waksmanii]|uniref:DNA polymerase III subunit chi n=1 Tax=Shewanella waksmanii TaxID=213783 RepID=UPI0037355698
MPNALFHVMPPVKQDPNSDFAPAMQAVYRLACELSQQAYSQQQLIYIHCQDQQQAYEIDELLWQFEPNAFVPHNLKGEGPTGGAPVEIGFDKLGPNKNRHVLVNLADQAPQFAVNFGHIIDFVANDDAKKAIARDRYRQYRDLGIQLSTENHQ